MLFTVEMCTHLAQDLEKLMKEILQFWKASGGAAGPGSAPYPEEWPADQQQYTKAATMPDTTFTLRKTMITPPFLPSKSHDSLWLTLTKNHTGKRILGNVFPGWLI